MAHNTYNNEKLEAMKENMVKIVHLVQKGPYFVVSQQTLPKHASQLVNQPLKQKSYALPYQMSMYASLK